MYVKVIPFEHSLHPRAYTYSVSDAWKDQLQRGSIVEIPLGKNLEYGVVTGDTPSGTSDIDTSLVKPVHRVIASTPILSPYILKSIEHIATLYALPIHKALALFLPVPLRKRLDKKNYILETSGEKPRQKKTPQKEIHHWIGRTFSPKDLSIYDRDNTVYIFPDDIFLSVFEDAIRKNIAESKVLYAEDTPTKRSQAWIDLYEGKYRKIFGTRRILSYNLHRFTSIVFFEDAFGGDFFQYPGEIKSLDILQILASTDEFDVTLVSSSPTLTLFAKLRDFTIITKK